MTIAASNPREPESEEKPQKSLNEKQQVRGLFHSWANWILHAWLIFVLLFIWSWLWNVHMWFLICVLCPAVLVQENQDLLIKCITQDLGFSGGKPIAACVIYKCLLHWRSFEVERTSVFDRIIQTIASAIEVNSRYVYMGVLVILNYNYSRHLCFFFFLNGYHHLCCAPLSGSVGTTY